MTPEDYAFLEIKRQVEAGAVARCRAISDRVVNRGFIQQRDFILDEERHKVLLAPRRAGKSYGVGLHMIYTMMLRPGANVVYIARSRDKAREIMWQELKNLNRDFEIDIKLSETYLGGWCPNGSHFRLRGCETVADIEAFIGEAFDLVVVDEGASHAPQLLDKLIDKALEATLGDTAGTMILTGTPGPVLAGRFYQTSGEPAFEVIDAKDEEGKPIRLARSRPFAEKTSPRWTDVVYGWSYHFWTRKENTSPRGKNLWKEALRIKLVNQWSDDNPIWMREYLGRWVPDGGNLVYNKFNPERNCWDPPPDVLPKDRFKLLKKGHVWRCALGIDFGQKDPTVAAVVAWSETCKEIYQIYERILPKEECTPPKWAEMISDISAAFPIDRAVGDFGPYGEMLQRQLAEEYGITVEMADKKDKRTFIELLNGDFHDQRCFVLRESEFTRQSMMLCWDDTGLKEKNQRNDACDALVYTWRLALHHFVEDPPEHKDPEESRLSQEADALEKWERQNQAALQEETSGWIDGYDQEGSEGW
jgi:hypothetical protein